MKQFSFIGILFSLHISVFSQNVGIGDTVPTHKLTVAGSIKAIDSMIASVLKTRKLVLADTSVINRSRIILDGTAGNQGDVLTSGGDLTTPFWGPKSILFWSPFALGYAFGDLNHQVSNNIEKTIIWKYPISNPHFLYDTATGKYTVLQSGAYNLDLHVCIGDISKNLPVYQVSMKVWKLNRALPLIDIIQVASGANTFNKMQATSLVILDAGEQFYATVFQNSGTTLLLNDIEGLTYISGYKVY